MIIQDLNFCEASVNEIVGGALLASPFSFNETVFGTFSATVGAFTAASNTTAGSTFTGTVLIDSVLGIVNGTTFTSSFFTGNTIQVLPGTTGVIIP